ncbi:hypothetical protein ATG_05330 [Desulfurococcaceae archaeon AG1]|jgi:vacuolar-type H+-ATPase subunit I/STV1|nr:hypothetical protein ATG_05330 [Desulfurococcaceae archaeon AG1]
MITVEDTGIWLRAIIVGIVTMLIGLALSIISFLAESPDIVRAAVSIIGLGVTLAGMYLAIKGFIGYIAVKASLRKKDR